MGIPYIKDIMISLNTQINNKKKIIIQFYVIKHKTKTIISNLFVTSK